MQAQDATRPKTSPQSLDICLTQSLERIHIGLKASEAEPELVNAHCKPSTVFMLGYVHDTLVAAKSTADIHKYSM